MIFVTVGSSPCFAFDRLIKKVDEVSTHFEEKFIVQRGCSRYIPGNVDSFTFASQKTVLEYYKQASLIIGHASAGPLIYAKIFNLPLILVPRLLQYNEIFNNHQYKFALAIKDNRMIEIVCDINNLEEKIRVSMNKKSLSWDSNEKPVSLISTIKEFILKLQ